MLAQDRLANLSPEYWLFWLGLLLIVVTLYLDGGVVGGLKRVAAWVHRRRTEARQ